MKIMNETAKILRAPKLPVSAFTVRVPVLNAHAEAVWVTLGQAGLSREAVTGALEGAAGVEVMDGKKSGDEGPGFATQAMASGTDRVYVSRIHKDLHDDSTWLMWVVADNLRKGAALNGCQIAERIFDITPHP